MASRFRCVLASFSMIFTFALVAGAEESSFSSATGDSSGFTAIREKVDLHQARIHYGVGLLCARNNRLLEATHHLEEAWRLDPTAAAVGRSLVPIYLALGRFEEALTLSRKTLELDPDDYETWYSYARQLRDQGKSKEALEAMTKAASCLALNERPLQLAQISYDLGIFLEDSSEPGRALLAFQNAEKTLFQHRETLVDSGSINDRQLNFELARVSEKIGKTSLKLAKYEDSIQAFETTQTIAREKLQDPIRAARLDLDLAKVHRLAGHLEKSLTVLDDFLKTQPAEIEPYRIRNALLMAMGGESEIIPSLEKFVDLDRHNLELRLLLADESAKNSGNWNKAQDTYEAVIRESPTPQAYHGLFSLLKISDKVEEILTSLDRSLAAANPKDKSLGDPSEALKARAMLLAIRQDPDLVRQLIPLGVPHGRRGPRLNFSTRYLLGVLAARTNQLEAAERFYQSCLTEPNGFPGFSPREQEVYSGLLQVLNLQGKYQEIIDTCREGLKNTQATNRLLFHEYLARTLSLLGRVDEALAEADQAVQLAEGSSQFHFHLLHAHVLSEANQQEQAIRECQELLQKTSNIEDTRQIRLTLYNVFTAAHENDKAEEQIRRVLHDHPDDAMAHNNLGYMLAEQGRNLAEAEELIRKAIELDRQQKQKETQVGPEDDQDNAAFVDSLGWVLFRRGRFQDALQELQKAATLQEGNDPVIWDHLGDVFFRLDLVAKARESWTNGVKLYEKEKRRRQDDQYKELKHKLEVLQNP